MQAKPGGLFPLLLLLLQGSYGGGGGEGGENPGGISRNTSQARTAEPTTLAMHAICLHCKGFEREIVLTRSLLFYLAKAWWEASVRLWTKVPKAAANDVGRSVGEKRRRRDQPPEQNTLAREKGI